MPDGLPDGLIDRMAEKSGVLPVPIEDRLFTEGGRRLDTRCPHLLWNHRWEYDKAPDRLLLLLDALRNKGQDFRLSVVGEQFRQAPDAFEQIRQRHGERILNWGFLQDRAEYDRLLCQADVVLSTALHDFQGLSMLEAMACGCLALAPERLAYPEYVPAGQLYASHEDDPEQEAETAADTLGRLLEESPAVGNAVESAVESAAPEAWRLSRLQKQYYQEIQTLLNRDQTN
jgi:glycosyltransferase involved in cell wall biosynthesis